jgi:predicted amidohydrolase YtcJ
MVVLDQNIFAIEADKIKDTNIIYTIMDGEVVYSH